MRSKYLEGILAKSTVNYFDRHPVFGTHVYATVTDELYTGCSTIAGAWDKSSFLSPWYSKEAVKALGWYDKYEGGKKLPKVQLDKLEKEFEVAFEELKKLSAKEYYDKLTNAKGAAKKIGKQAGDYGTIAHDWIENWVNQNFDSSIILPDLPKDIPPKNAVNAFLDWVPNKKVDWLLSEEVINSNTHKVAGRMDAFGIYNYLPTIIDFKTSGQISVGYLLQLAGYHLMIEEMGFAPRQWLILRIPKDGNKAETLTIRDAKLMKFCVDTFLAIRQAHKFFVYAENKLKDPKTGKLRIDIPDVKVETT